MKGNEAKNVYVILAFHAHEPLWDLPSHIERQQADIRVVQAVSSENLLRKRFKEGRNIYRDLMSFAQSLGTSVTVDISNDLLHQIRIILPRTFAELQRAYEKQVIYPLYTTAHHTHAVLLEPEEMAEELRWNQEAIHDIMGAPRPRHQGFFFTECSVHPKFFGTLEKAGIEYVIHPHLSERKGIYTVSDPSYNYVYRPFSVGNNLIALPRHFRVSQEIWRPITKMYPQEVKYQGYILGAYYVFDTEYQEKRFLEFPITRMQGVAEYEQFLRQAVDEAPDGGLILYIQDLELMDFGDIALELLHDAWASFLAETPHNVHFVTPDDYLDTLPEPPTAKVDIKGMGWAPEVRVLLRSDGHYPPAYAGEYRGVDAGPQIWRAHPFIYWEPGKYLMGLFSWLLRAYGLPRLLDVHAGVLSDENYQLYRFPDEKRLAMGFRLLKQADNWGWQPNEALNKRPYTYGMMLADSLMVLSKFYPKNFPVHEHPLDPRNIVGIGRLPEGLIGPRIEYLRFGLERLREERPGYDPSEAFRQIDYAQDFRYKAGANAERLLELYRGLEGNFHEPMHWQRLLLEIRDHCQNMFLSLDHLQRCWMAAGETEFLVEMMYRYLYDMYPPRFPDILDEIDQGLPSKERLHGGMRLIHLIIPADSSISGHHVREITTSEDALIVTLRRGRRVIVPRGDTILMAGDNITIATSRERNGKLEDFLVLHES